MNLDGPFDFTNKENQHDTPEDGSDVNLKNFQQSQAASEPTEELKAPYVPPIVINNPTNVPQLLHTLSTLTDELGTGRIVASDKLKIFPPTSAAHRTITKKIEKDGLKSHILSLTMRRKLRLSLEVSHQR
ncbi:hypothetical protein AVEN_174407-1 [Araneus ventricosus]|uniref:Uncharacterized protein n=1 Tax=Araneus ventricosus TaxID=182803 RepID=A0A4Y2GZD4_ARAVE|nr:hypothetical protein AVEN_174407-1 [Araneus ventricosus]